MVSAFTGYDSAGSDGFFETEGLRQTGLGFGRLRVCDVAPRKTRLARVDRAVLGCWGRSCETEKYVHTFWGVHHIIHTIVFPK